MQVDACIYILNNNDMINDICIVITFVKWFIALSQIIG